MLTNAQAALLAASTLHAGGQWAGQPMPLAKEFKEFLDKQDAKDQEDS